MPMSGYPGHFVAAPPAWGTPPAAAALAAGHAAPSGVDAALAAAASGTGPQAEQAMRLLTLQVLSRLGGDRAKPEAAKDFEEYAFRLLGGGAGSAGAAGPDAGLDAGGRGGSAQLLRIQTAIKRDPRAWTAYFNDFLRRQLGAEELNTGWSTAEYARRKIEWGKSVDLEHAYHLVAEIHRLMHNQEYDMAEAFVCQTLKSFEQVILDRGDWQLAWAYTGLPELRSTSRVRRGGAHPVEISAGMAYLKEMRAVEEWRAGAKKGPKGAGKEGE